MVAYFKGMMGQPEFGFPQELQKLVLKGEEPITVRPGELLEPEDFDKIREELAQKHHIEPTMKDIISYALYPKVFDDYLTYIRENGDFSRMESHIFFHGIKEGEPVKSRLTTVRSWSSGCGKWARWTKKVMCPCTLK